MRTLKSLLSNPSRLFWTLQIVGWCCYSILGFSAKVGEGAPPRWIFFYLAVGACGFALTSLLRLGYRYVWNWPTPHMALAAAGLPAAGDPGADEDVRRDPRRFLRRLRDAQHVRLPLVFRFHLYLLLSWSGLYFGIKFAGSCSSRRKRR